jgi:hypothetical protein
MHIFSPEDGGSIFLRNIGMDIKECTVAHPEEVEF